MLPEGWVFGLSLAHKLKVLVFAAAGVKKMPAVTIAKTLLQIGSHLHCVPRDDAGAQCQRKKSAIQFKWLNT